MSRELPYTEPPASPAQWVNANCAYNIAWFSLPDGTRLLRTRCNVIWRFVMKMRQVMDWQAAVKAGLIAGLIALLVVAIPAAANGYPWSVFQWIAALVLGDEVLTQSTELTSLMLILGLLIHFTLSIIYTLILAFIIHRWGFWVGVFGGAVFGLALFVINYYTFTLLFPWFLVMRSWTVVIAHLVFGAVAGGVYEAMEVERFVPVESEAESAPPEVRPHTPPSRS